MLCIYAHDGLYEIAADEYCLKGRFLGGEAFTPRNPGGKQQEIIQQVEIAYEYS